MKLKKLICMMLVLCMIAAHIPMSVSAAEVVSGTCGENLTWVLSSDGTLTISGTGTMDDYDYTSNKAPWSSYADQIVKIVISSGVTSIGSYSFYNHRAVAAVSLPEGLAEIHSHAFYCCLELTEVILPDTVEVIADNAFSGTSIPEIHIPASTTTLSPLAFDVAGLKGIWVHKDNPSYSNDAYGILFNKDKTILIACPGGFSGEYTVPAGVIEIGDWAFSASPYLTGVSIPSSVTTIGFGAFEFSLFLETVTLSEGLLTIGREAFMACENLTHIIIPSSVTSIGMHGFFACTNVSEVQFLGDAPTIMEDAFGVITANVYYPEGNETWTDETMQNYGGILTWIPFDSCEDGHSYVNGICTNCGEADPGYEPPTTDPEPTPETDTMIRLAGSNRWETSLKVADEMKANLGVEKFDAIIIASGNDFADALAGSYLATVKNAPILLSWGKGGNYVYLDENNIDYIKSNLASGGTVYILGGVNAVPGLYEDALAGYNVKRLGGANRFETNLLILKEAGVQPGQEILVCTSTNFADSLSASATGLPILLVFNDYGKLYGAQPDFLAGLNGNTFCVVGGESAVSSALEAEIAKYGTTTRLAGANRFETSVMVAEKYFSKPESAVLAYAWNYPDGLCGGPLAYTMDAPLILTMTKYEATAAAYVAESGIERGVVLGGTGLISDDAVRTISPTFPNLL